MNPRPGSEDVRTLDSTFLTFRLGFSIGSVVKNPPAMQETSIRSLGWEDPLEKEMTMHSSILAWIIPWTEEPGGYNPWSHKELDTTERALMFLLDISLQLDIEILGSEKDIGFRKTEIEI